MIDPFNQILLTRIFEIDESNHLKRNESTQLEFKQSFGLGELEEYARDFAAFANNKGGHLVYGIKDSPHEIVGLTGDSFSKLDLERLTGELNSIFSQAIIIEKYEHDINGKKIGILYIFSSDDKPVIAKKNYGKIKEADIYFRYGARTERIRYSELKHIMGEIAEKEKSSWMRVFKQTAKIGASNTAVLDTLDGTIQGNSNKIIAIDDNLIDKLKFIREGHFKEDSGKITLRLVGDLVPATVIRQGTKTVFADPYVFNPSMVAKKVSEETKKMFRSNSEHVWAWKYYQVRPQKNAKRPNNTKRNFCELKTALNTYLYTQAWVDFLVKEMSDDKKYKTLVDSKGINISSQKEPN